MDRSADTLELSVALEVEKKKPTQTERKAKEKPDISDFLISGGKIFSTVYLPEFLLILAIDRIKISAHYGSCVTNN